MISSILFWDIDGTLLTTGRAGILAWEQSFEVLAGRRISLENYPTAGLTDVEIATNLAKEIGPTSRSVIKKLLKGYEDRLPSCLPSRQGFVLPGIIDILRQLQTMPSVSCMLLTGNTARGAAAKLTYYGLNKFFKLGAFADNSIDRPAIAKAAMLIADKELKYNEDKQFFVIGDTPHDIHCGKAIGAKTVAVCTGQYDREALTKHSPWLVIESLADTFFFFKALKLLHFKAG